MLFSFTPVVNTAALAVPVQEGPSVLQTTDTFKSSTAPIVNPVIPFPTATVPIPEPDEATEQKIATEPLKYYVPKEPHEPYVDDMYQIIHQQMPRQTDVGYVTIFLLKNQSQFDIQPRASFNQVKPPLVIEYNVTLLTITDI
ncbi:MAG: hypothetical protein WCF90_10680 [Methanomicrobiales archaeon]